MEKVWPLATAILAGLVSLNLLVQWVVDWSPSFLTFQLGFAFLTLAIPFVLALLGRAINHELPAQLDKLAPASDSSSERGDARVPVRSLLGGLLPSGFIMLVAGYLSTEIFGIPWTGGVRVLFYSWAFCFFVGYGFAAWLYVILMLVAKEVSKIKLEAQIFSWPRAALQDVFAVYMKTFLIGAVLYVGAVVTVWISPGGAWIAQNTGIGRLWVFPPGAMVVLFFLQFNFSFRAVLVGLRRSSEERLSELAESKFREWCDSPAENSASSVDALLNWRAAIRSEDVWPLNYKSLLATVATLMLPTVKAVLELL